MNGTWIFQGARAAFSAANLGEGSGFTSATLQRAPKFEGFFFFAFRLHRNGPGIEHLRTRC